MATSRPLVRFTAVHGTWHRRAPWARPTSEFCLFMRELNVVPLTPDDPFEWSGRINGWQFWRRWGWGSKDGDLGDWLLGGASLRWKLDGFDYPDRGLIVHSHGLWPALVAMSQGLTVPWMVSVGSPVRADMFGLIHTALPQLGAWLHVYDSEEDDWGLRGGIGDGRICFNRAQPFAGVHNTAGRFRRYTVLYPRRGGNDPILGIGHSLVLTDPQFFALWQSRKWVDFMAAASPVVGA